MPSRAWVVTLLASCLMDLLLLFQCPHGLELLRLHKTRISFLKEFQCPHGLELLLIMDGMPVQRIRFNALSGLSCYNWLHYNIFRYHCCFNALSGLSCYHDTCICSVVLCKFQCPLGLELLRSTCSRSRTGKEFQCPLGLELLRQECPIF